MVAPTADTEAPKLTTRYQLNRPPRGSREPAEISQFNLDRLSNGMVCDNKHPSRKTPLIVRTGMPLSLPYQQSTRWQRKCIAAETIEELRQASSGEVVLPSSQSVAAKDRRVGRTEDSVATKSIDFDSKVQYGSFPHPAASQETFPSVVRALLHERIKNDLRPLLQELQQSANGCLDLKRALHAAVDRGFIHAGSCSIPRAAAATVDDPLLRGFWSIQPSQPAKNAGNAAASAGDETSPHLLQQLWRQYVILSDKAQAIGHPAEQIRDAHSKAHHRPPGLQLCRVLGSNGAFLHIPYAPYQQSIGKGRGQSPKRDRV